MITYPTDKLQKVLLGGGCEQRNLPSEYTQVERINNNGTAWLDLGIPIGSSDILTFDLAWNASRITPFFGAYNSGGSFSTQSFVGTYADSSESFCFYANSNSVIGTYTPKPTVRAILKWNGINAKPTLNGSEIGPNNPPYQNFTPNVNSYLFTRNQGGTVGSVDNITLYGFKVERNGATVMNLIPARRNSDSVLGMYDTVTGNFLTNQGTGTFTAGADVVPSPDTPMDIVCNNGVVKVSPNLFNTSTITLNCRLTNTIDPEYGSTGGQRFDIIAQEGQFVSALVPVEEGATYLKNSQTPNALNRFKVYDINKISVRISDTNSITIKAGEKYIAFCGYTSEINSLQVVKGVTLPPYMPYGQIYTDGTQEVVTDNLGNTANADRLLAVGDYKDTQEVLAGSVTRNVGIKVLDGTESWVKANGTNDLATRFVFYINEGGDAMNSSGLFCMSNIALGVGNAWANTGVTVRGNKNFGFINMPNMTINSTVTDWTTYLADQYSAGTPVIIVYPPATPTTEQVTPQPLAGNSITQTAGSIDNLPIESSTIAELKKRYIGDKEVKRVYIGDNLVWENN